MIRNKRKDSGLDAILSANAIPADHIDSRNFTRDSLCHNLLKVTKKLHTAEHYAYAFRNNQRLNQDFSKEEIESDLLETIVHVLNAWETYWGRKKKKKVANPINLAPTTELNTFGKVKGYLLQAFQNNLRKKYTQYKTDKRSLSKVVISLDAPAHQDDGSNATKSLHDELVAGNCEIARHEYQQGIAFLIKHLRNYDKTENERLSKLYPHGPLAVKRQSRLAWLFVMLLNPRYQGNIEEIRDRLGWTDYIFKRNRELLFSRLRSDYPELGGSLLSHIVQTQHQGVIGEARESKRAETSPKKKQFEVHSVFSMKQEKSKTKYSLTVSIDELVNGSWKPVKVVKKRVLVMPGTSDLTTYQQAKEKLQTQSRDDIMKAKKLMIKNS